jgi:hypothetical protein
MAKEAADVWRGCFQSWPQDLERRGVLVTSFGEQIAFDGFATSDELLLVERRTPDTVGGRTILIDYAAIQAVKIVDVTKLKSFLPMGFVAPPPRK